METKNAYMGRLTPCTSKEEYLAKVEELSEEARKKGCEHILAEPVYEGGTIVYLNFTASNRPFPKGVLLCSLTLLQATDRS